MRSPLRILVLLVAFTGLGIAQTDSSASSSSSSSSSSPSSSEVASLLAEFPACALLCLLEAVAASNCTSSDIACQCSDATMISTAEICVTANCTIVESLTAKNLTQTMCGAEVRDKGAELNVIEIVLVALACVFVAVRLGYRKFFTTTDLGLDDWCILLNLMICVPAGILNVTLLTHNGLGRDIWTLTEDQITDFARGFWIITLLYFIEVFVIKLSMLFFYLRIFPGRGVRRLILGTVAFDVMFGVGFVLAAILQCQPISYNWTGWRKEGGGGQCVDISAVAWANAAVSIALDIWMLGIPLSQLKDLKLHWKKKLGVAMMFCVGTFVTVVSVIRLASIVEFRESTNLSWDYWGITMWSTVEIAVGMMCACMPSMRLILVRIAPKIFDSTLKNPSRYYYPRKSVFSGKRWTDVGTEPSQIEDSKKNKSATGSRASWIAPNVRTSWRVSRSVQKDKMMYVDGTLFSKVSNKGTTIPEEDKDRLVQLVDLDRTKYGTEIRIYGGASSGSASPDRPTVTRQWESTTSVAPVEKAVVRSGKEEWD